jgi:ubiquinone/menaquinone biosynthesis C-methylase UbiE
MTNQPDLYKQFAAYYDLIYATKDFQGEAELALECIQHYKTTPGRQLLDDACGTGEHLHYLKPHYDCQGTDLNAEMLTLAQSKHPEIPLMQADMVTMNLEQSYDAITCFFGSIGYVKTLENLQAAWRNLARHLKPGGVLIVEPWFRPDQFQAGVPYMKQYDGQNTKLARLFVSEVDNNVAMLDFHYLIAERNGTTRHIQDHHEIALFSHQQMVQCMQEAGLEGFLIQRPPLNQRGLYVAQHAHSG